MTTAAAANEYRYNLGHDFTLADAYDDEFMDEAGDEDETARQALNLRMAEWYGVG
jgi:hypothetical protein